MQLEIILSDLKKEQTGNMMFRLIETLYPICRSITGKGVRSTLNELNKFIPIQTTEVPTGTTVFDWTIPKEWNITDAWIKDLSGEKIIDFSNSNLHILNYSTPINKRLHLTELKPHLYTLPQFPDWIPYKTSYYAENWGFCMTHRQFLELKDQEYQVFIDSTLKDGSLTYGEFYIPGKSKEEVLFSAHICHPSLCNDNLSGIAVMTFLAQTMTKIQLKYSYRFIFIPGTIGSITWLAKNEDKVQNIRAGLILSCLGDLGDFTYKKSRRGDSEIDRMVNLILKQTQPEFNIVDFYPYGYDERQFCSPGFNLPVGSLSRSAHGTFKEYHTSADNLDFIKAGKLLESLNLCLRVIHAIESNKYFINTNPKCEPQLGKRGLYSAIGGHQGARTKEMAMLWILNMSDGHHSLSTISEKSNIDFPLIYETALILENYNLIKEVS